MKIAVLSSYTIDLIQKQAAKYLARQGISAEWYLAPFNQYSREILDPQSPSKSFMPDLVLISIDCDEILHEPDKIISLIAAASKQYESATVLVHNCFLPRNQPIRFVEWNQPISRRYNRAKFNCAIADAAQKLKNVYILDLESIVEKFGLEKMVDSRLYYLAKMIFSSFGTQKVAEQLATQILAVKGKRKKCLILDLDNTLWGGILGEDGVEHIQLSNDGQGKAFYDFQTYILMLYQSGIILGICSKNDEALALEAIEKHPYMILRKEHFAGWRINWLDKIQNLRSLAEELNIGLDSMVFLDDSPQERELVKVALPEVAVPEMPKDFSEYPEYLAQISYFETFSVTAEDVRRGEMYAQERERTEFRQSAGSFEDYLQALEIRVRVETATDFTIPRIAQLTQRTNQFNLTTRRYTESEILCFLEKIRWKVMGISSADKFGDSGLVGAALVELLEDNVARLDSFLMSCRVLGRGIEQAFLTAVLNTAKGMGAQVMKAEYLPTEKNGIARNFLIENEFILDQRGYFIRNLDALFEIPRWIKFDE